MELVQKQTKKASERTSSLRLPRGESDKLHSKIYKEINRMVKEGLTSNSACKRLATESSDILGYNLSYKQIRGRYLRWKKQ